VSLLLGDGAICATGEVGEVGVEDLSLHLEFGVDLGTDGVSKVKCFFFVEDTVVVSVVLSEESFEKFIELCKGDHVRFRVRINFNYNQC